MTINLQSRGSLLLLILSCLYVALLAAITALNSSGPDRYWLGALNLYLPQAMWLLPGFILAAWYLKSAPRLVWIPLLCLLWVAGPIMGFCWPRHRTIEVPGAVALRVMTCNIKYGKRDVMKLIEDMDLHRPDLVMFQDADYALSGPLAEYFSRWQVRSYGQYIIASRYPLSELEVRRTSIYKGKSSCVRCQVHLGEAVVTLYNVHLRTPREGLNAFRTVKRRPWYLPVAVERFEGNVEGRLSQAQAVRDMVGSERGAVIVAGDLNSPDTSLACATLREAGLHDAFAEGGKGYGYTYGHLLLQHRIPWILQSWMRIDHIMMSPEMRAVRCWTGTDLASEHRPVVADLVLLRH